MKIKKNIMKYQHISECVEKISMTIVISEWFAGIKLICLWSESK